MTKEHCAECADKEREIRDLESKISDLKERLREAESHLQEVEHAANVLYRMINTSVQGTRDQCLQSLTKETRTWRSKQST